MIQFFKLVIAWLKGFLFGRKGVETKVSPSPRKRGIISRVEWPKEKGDYSYGPRVYGFDNAPVRLGGDFPVFKEPPAPPPPAEHQQSYPPFRRSTTENWRSESKVPEMMAREKHQRRQRKETDSVNPVSKADHVKVASKADRFKTESKAELPRIEGKANGPIVRSLTSTGHKAEA